jgi:hypothetical protein
MFFLAMSRPTQTADKSVLFESLLHPGVSIELHRGRGWYTHVHTCEGIWLLNP